MLYAYYAIVITALACMLINLYLVFGLKRFAPGGIIGGAINTLVYFVVLFTLGYLLTPAMPGFTFEMNLFLTGTIYLFGALFVLLVLRLIRSLITRVFKELE